MNEFELKEKLEKERKEIKSFDDLMSFLQKVKDDCNSGYGEAPRAIAQAALATASYLSSEFGITGFQAGFIMWDFIFGWSYTNNKCGLKIVNYDDMLYPQYEDRFIEKKLDKDVFETMQKEATKLLEERDEFAHPDVVEHWKSIADGKVPFGYVLQDK